MDQKQLRPKAGIPVFVWLMSLLYVLAGINHFINPAWYLRIMPPYLPFHLPLVYISGVVEIIFGLLLLFRSTMKFASYGIIILLIAIFPANVQMMLNYYHSSNPYLWIAIVRLPLQLLLIWWAWKYANSRSDAKS